MDATVNMTPLRFLKMHGLGNDFVVIDARGEGPCVTPEIARAIGDRHRGVGYDQLAVIRDGDGVDAVVDYWNSDGSLSDACGNATRCVARLLMDETGRDHLELRTGRGILPVYDAGDGLITVNMGPPQTDWAEIPLSHALDPLVLEFPAEMGRAGAVGMGNPHCVFLIDDVPDDKTLEAWGRSVEHDPRFPKRTNVEFVTVHSSAEARMRVWERGTGITLACGSGACAAGVVAHLQGVMDRKLTLHMDGGPIGINWREDGVHMTGPTALVFEGVLDPARLLADAS